jgi:ribosomal protein S12 methylthiotransferase
MTRLDPDQGTDGDDDQDDEGREGGEGGEGDEGDEGGGASGGRRQEPVPGDPGLREEPRGQRGHARHPGQEGLEARRRPEEARVIVVNTCSFIRDAKQESVDTILEMARHKQDGRCTTLVVAGCMPQRYSKRADGGSCPRWTTSSGPGPTCSSRDLLDAEDAPRALVPDPDYVHDARTPRVNSMPSYTAYVKVSEGCDNACAFCVIPQIRGPQRSRPVEDVVAEVRKLARQGCVELNLIAQDLTAYGLDLPGKPRLHSLLRELCKVPGPRWLRLHYAYPRDFPDELVEVIASEEKIVKYLDMPVQHVSDRLLRSMRRGARRGVHFRSLLGKLRERVPASCCAPRSSSACPARPRRSS